MVRSRMPPGMGCCQARCSHNLGGFRRRNSRYDLRPWRGMLPVTTKAVSQRKVKSKPQEPVFAKSDEGFPQFSRLPQEIRLKIWDMVTDEPRAVIINYLPGFPRGFISPTPVPAALHVCVESREVALKKYKLSFAAHDARCPIDCHARIWFNFEADMVYFRNRSQEASARIALFRSSVVMKDLERIQFLGTDIERGTNEFHNWPMPPLHERAKAWAGLKVLYRCHESGRMKLNKPLTFSTLRGNKERAFVKQYRWTYGKNGRFKGLSVSAALEDIRRESITSSGLNGASTPEIGLVTVANSKSLGC